MKIFANLIFLIYIGNFKVIKSESHIDVIEKVNENREKFNEICLNDLEKFYGNKLAIYDGKI